MTSLFLLYVLHQCTDSGMESSTLCASFSLYVLHFHFMAFIFYFMSFIFTLYAAFLLLHSRVETIFYLLVD